MKKEFVGYNEIMNIVKEMDKILKNGEKNKTIEKIKKKYQDKVEKLEEAILN